MFNLQSTLIVTVADFGVAIIPWFTEHMRDFPLYVMFTTVMY